LFKQISFCSIKELVPEIFNSFYRVSKLLFYSCGSAKFEYTSDNNWHTVSLLSLTWFESGNKIGMSGCTSTNFDIYCLILKRRLESKSLFLKNGSSKWHFKGKL